MRNWDVGSRLRQMAIFFAPIALFVIWSFALVPTWMKSPYLTDITTTPHFPPEFADPKKMYLARNRDTQKAIYPDLSPLFFELPVDVVFEKAVETAQGLAGWKIENKFHERSRIEARAISRLLRLVDDVIIEIRAVPQGCEVHVRSRSRLGVLDLGSNARRIRFFLALLQVRLLKRTS